MNRIIEVNADLAYAVIEPGVRYRQLHEYLQKQQIKLAVDPIDDTAHASVIGNALDLQLMACSHRVILALWCKLVFG